MSNVSSTGAPFWTGAQRDSPSTLQALPDVSGALTSGAGLAFWEFWEPGFFSIG
jgi:hypothetical protein